MTILFTILVVLVCAVLAFFVLIQNPKGGGLADNVGGLSNQLMGVKQTTDVLEKGTWYCISALIVLAITSSVFLKTKSVNTDATNAIKGINANQTAPKK